VNRVNWMRPLRSRCGEYMGTLGDEPVIVRLSSNGASGGAGWTAKVQVGLRERSGSGAKGGIGAARMCAEQLLREVKRSLGLLGEGAPK